MADSLSDDLAIDENLVSVHSDASDVGEGVEIGSDVWDNQSVVSQDQSHEPQPQQQQQQQGGKGNQMEQSKERGDQAPAHENKKRKRKEHEKARKAKVSKHEVLVSILFVPTDRQRMDSGS